MSRSIFYITFFLLSIINCDAQKYDYNWILGGPHVEEVQLKKILLTFSDTSVHISQIDAFGSAVNSYIVSASDEEGKLIFYCNGLRFYTRDHYRMPGGDSLGYDINPRMWNTLNKIGYMGAAHNPGRFIPFPDHPGQYLVFLPYTNDRDSNPNLPTGTDLTYARIDMNLNNGKGRVIEKNELILDSVIDGYDLVQHANGRDWWLVMPVFMTNGFQVFLITPDGILGPVKQITGPEFKTGPIFEVEYPGDPYRGSQICIFSPDGKTLIRNHYYNGLYIYDFNRCTGEINFNKRVSTPKIWYFTFSPNSRYIYYNRVGGSSLTFQHDLYSQDTTDAFVLIGKLGDGVRISPDHRIFSRHSGTIIWTIEKPNLPGPACDIKQASYFLPDRIGGFPVFPNYRLGPLPGTDCDGMDNLYTPYGDPQYYSVEGRTYTHSKRYQLVKDDSWLIFYH